GLLGLAVQLTPAVASALCQQRGAQLKALCRSCPSRLRASLAGHKPPLLLLSGLPEALHAALPKVRDLLQIKPPGWNAEARDPLVPGEVPAVSMVPMGDYSLWVWLKSLDGGVGEMLIYCERLNELFQDISQLSAVQSGPFGEVPDPRFLQ
ncbi:unnamed protein product, partial [Symbiodinium pilosum]